MIFVDISLHLCSVPISPLLSASSVFLSLFELSVSSLSESEYEGVHTVRDRQSKRVREKDSRAREIETVIQLVRSRTFAPTTHIIFLYYITR